MGSAQYQVELTKIATYFEYNELNINLFNTDWNLPSFVLGHFKLSVGVKHPMVMP